MAFETDFKYICLLYVEEFMEYDSVVVFLHVARAYTAKFFMTSH